MKVKITLLCKCLLTPLLSFYFLNTFVFMFHYVKQVIIFFQYVIRKKKLTIDQVFTM